ncbi:GPR1/FUN34/yaaH family-domain-containing protein [Phyllosticta capitalensis]
MRPHNADPVVQQLHPTKPQCCHSTSTTSSNPRRPCNLLPIAHQRFATQYVPCPPLSKRKIEQSQHEATLHTPFAIGAFATTLTTLSCSLMEWRGVTTTNAFVGNFLFLAGVGMVVSAQWEMARGNTWGYMTLSAYGLFYAGFGAVVTPAFGVAAAYGGDDTVEYNNAMGFYMTIWTVFNTIFLVGSFAVNLVTIATYLTLELLLLLVGTSYFAAADGHAATSVALKQAGGACGFVSGLTGFYTVGSAFFEEMLGWHWPMGDVKWLERGRRTRGRGV